MQQASCAASALFVGSLLFGFIVATDALECYTTNKQEFRTLAQTSQCPTRFDRCFKFTCLECPPEGGRCRRVVERGCANLWTCHGSVSRIIGSCVAAGGQNVQCDFCYGDRCNMSSRPRRTIGLYSTSYRPASFVATALTALLLLSASNCALL